MGLNYSVNTCISHSYYQLLSVIIVRDFIEICIHVRNDLYFLIETM